MPALLSPSSALTRSTRLSWRILDGEALILHPEAGTLHRLNGSGTRMWELLDGQRSLEAIAASLTDEYEVGADEALAQLLEVADELLQAELVIVEDRP
jgi:hypothetical protein